MRFSEWPKSAAIFLMIYLMSFCVNCRFAKPVCTTNCKDALEHIVQLLAVKFDANLTNKSEMIYDTVMSL